MISNPGGYAYREAEPSVNEPDTRLPNLVVDQILDNDHPVRSPFLDKQQTLPYTACMKVEIFPRKNLMCMDTFIENRHDPVVAPITFIVSDKTTRG